MLATVHVTLYLTINTIHRCGRRSSLMPLNHSSKPCDSIPQKLCPSTPGGEVERHEKILPDTVATEYVAHVAASTAQHGHLSVPLVTRIIAGKEVRSIALPGGFLYITSGLVARTETEAELAGVLAHEIAHIARRDGMRQLSRDPNSPASSVSIVFMGPWSGACTRFSGDKLVPVAMRPVLKELEREADSTAIRYLRAAHYDPLGMLEFFTSLGMRTRGWRRRGHRKICWRCEPTSRTISRPIPNIL